MHFKVTRDTKLWSWFISDISKGERKEAQGNFTKFPANFYTIEYKIYSVQCFTQFILIWKKRKFEFWNKQLLLTLKILLTFPFFTGTISVAGRVFSLKEHLWQNIYLATDFSFFSSLCISSYLIDELFQETLVFWDLFEIFLFEDVVNQIWLFVIIRTENNKKGYIFQSLQFLHRILLDAGCIIHGTIMSETKKGDVMPRGRSQTTLTYFWAFWPPSPLVDSFT